MHLAYEINMNSKFREKIYTKEADLGYHRHRSNFFSNHKIRLEKEQLALYLDITVSESLN